MAGNGDDFLPWRCRNLACGNLLARLEPVPGGILEIKCRVCNTINAVSVAPTSLRGYAIVTVYENVPITHR